MADGRYFEKSKNAVLLDIINSLLKNGNKTANIGLYAKNYSLCTLLTSKDWKPQKNKKGNVNHTNIDIPAMLVWLTLPFYNSTVFNPSLL